jgi:hypothetical protein
MALGDLSPASVSGLRVFVLLSDVVQLDPHISGSLSELDFIANLMETLGGGFGTDLVSLLQREVRASFALTGRERPYPK